MACLTTYYVPETRINTQTRMLMKMGIVREMVMVIVKYKAYHLPNLPLRHLHLHLPITQDQEQTTPNPNLNPKPNPKAN